MFSQVFLQGYLEKTALKTEHMVRPKPAAPAAGPGTSVPGLGAGHSFLGGYLGGWLRKRFGQPGDTSVNFGVDPGVMRLKGQQAIRNMPAADKAQIANQAGKAFNPAPAK
jgi:hypothetical protein